MGGEVDPDQPAADGGACAASLRVAGRLRFRGGVHKRESLGDGSTARTEHQASSREEQQGTASRKGVCDGLEPRRSAAE